jgi:hypothetical protein
LSARVAYLERDGVTRDGEKGCMFGATEDRTDAMTFARRGLNDRQHFRFIVTPEDAAEMTDFKAFTRDLVTSSARWRAISAPSWGLASRMGTPTPASPRYAARQMTVPISSSRAIPSARARARGCGPGLVRAPLQA